ncbi:MAG: Integrase family protein [Candidatus Brocadiaceae bacterium]|nr:Integrase family protein [Candidatus Brocadiaceae bacterium]
MIASFFVRKPAKNLRDHIMVVLMYEYRLDKITPFVIEKFRVERKEKDSVKEGTVNDDAATLKNLFKARQEKRSLYRFRATYRMNF